MGSCFSVWNKEGTQHIIGDGGQQQESGVEALICLLQILLFLLPLFSLCNRQWSVTLIEWNARVLGKARQDQDDDESTDEEETGAIAGSVQNDLPPIGLTLMLQQSAGWTLYFGLLLWKNGVRADIAPMITMAVGFVLSLCYIVYYGCRVMIPSLYKAQFQCQLGLVTFLLCLQLIFFGTQLQNTSGVFMIVLLLPVLVSPLFLIIRTCQSCDTRTFGPTLGPTFLVLLQSTGWAFLGAVLWADWYVFLYFLAVAVMHFIVLVFWGCAFCCSGCSVRGDAPRRGYKPDEFARIFDKDRKSALKI
ncbi:unnamed protein product [Amoebophrya sp. A120]|nr:unnamed protein product [Amoebophrya sp. A120]|eukprot:GSA120T00003080001.1